MMPVFTHLLRLGRPGMAPLTASVPVLGALTLAAPLNAGDFVALALLGLLAHGFGFGLNDLLDLPLDRRLPARRNQPLVTGQIAPGLAWGYVLGQAALALLLYALAFRGAALGFALLVASCGLSTLYNAGSKRGPIPRLLAESALAVSIGLLCLCGALAQTAAPPAESAVFALALALILLLLNSVPSGLKDLKTDARYGAQSFVLAVGCRMADHDRMIIVPFLRRYSAALQLGILACLVALAALYCPPPLLAGLALLLAGYGGLHLRMLLRIESFAALRRSGPLLGGFYNYAALASFVVAWLPWPLALLYGLGVVALITYPLRVSWRLWRGRYRQVA